MNLKLTVAATGIALGMLMGCQKEAKAPPAVTAEDVAAAEQKAAKQVDDAKLEASKDVKSALKVAGPGSNDVTHAKAEGAFDVAMSKADGAHLVDGKRCLTLPQEQQAGCTAQADADYETAKASAKALRARTESK